MRIAEKFYFALIIIGMYMIVVLLSSLHTTLFLRKGVWNNDLQIPRNYELQNATIQQTTVGRVPGTKSKDHQNHGQSNLQNHGTNNLQNLESMASSLYNLTNSAIQNPKETNRLVNGSSVRLIDRNKARSRVNSKSKTSLVDPSLIKPAILDAIPMILSPEPCSEDIYLVSFVHSALKHAGRRTLIRLTRKISVTKVKTIFILGSGSLEDMRSVEQEAKEFTDIAQFRYLDSYRTLTFKHLMGLRWVKEFCSNAKYLLKTDDDVIINTNIILNKLQAIPSMPTGIYCYVHRKGQPHRNPGSKWYTTRKEYPGGIYPDFCSGFAYLVSTQWVPKLYKATETERFLWLDDVYVTGILAQKVSLPRYDMNKYLQYLFLYKRGEETEHKQDITLASIVVHQDLRDSAELFLQIWCKMSGSASNVRNCRDYKHWYVSFCVVLISQIPEIVIYKKSHSF